MYFPKTADRYICMSITNNDYTIPPNRNPNFAGPCLHKPVDTRCTSCIMDTSCYFSALSVAAKRDLQHSLNLCKFSKRQTLYKESDRCRHLYILISGEIKIYKTLPNGKQQIHKLAQVPGDLIACEDLYLDRHGSSAEALNDVHLCHLKRDDLRQSMQRHPEISDTMMQAMSRNLNAYIKHIANLGQKSALERLASYLVYLNDTHYKRHLEKNYLKDSLSRVELADMLGVTQRTLIRSIKQLETENLIQIDRRGFIIIDLARLEQISAAT